MPIKGTSPNQRADRLEHALSTGAYDLSGIIVRREDSIKAGNCAPGTDAFMQRFEGILRNRTEISVAEMLRLELATARYALARWLHERGRQKPPSNPSCNRPPLDDASAHRALPST